MINKNNQKDENPKKVFKSLYQVKDIFLPNANLDFLESKDDDISREAFTKMIQNMTHPTQQKHSSDI